MISREELYQLVWSQPMTKVAEQFDVSGSYMARVCSILNVPRPERGYWAKLAVNKAPIPLPLPEAQPGDQLYWSQDGEVRPPVKSKQLSQRAIKTKVRVPKAYVHNLIRGAKTLFENSRPVDEDAYLRPFKKLLVDITVSKVCLDKALDFANDLFNTFESAGHRVVIAPSDEKLRRAAIDEREVQNKPRNNYFHTGSWSPYRPTVVYIDGIAIGLSVIEMSEEILLRYVRGKYIRDADYAPTKSSRHDADHTWTTSRNIPSGRLRLVAYSPYGRVHWSNDWNETKTASLSSLVKTIVKHLEEAVTELVAKLDEAERKAEIDRQEWRAAEERRRREEDTRRTEQSIKESKEQLAQIIQKWGHVMDIERFLTGVEQRAAELPESERVRIVKRMELAREFLGSQDPLDFFMSWNTPRERYKPLFAESSEAET